MQAELLVCISGEASHAFWTVAPASLALPQMRPVALGAAVIFGTAVGALRVAFGRHFVSDVVFAGLITIAIVMALYRLLLDPIRRNDARLERGVERASVALHRGIGTLLGGGGPGPRSGGPALPSGRPGSTCTSASPAYSRAGSNRYDRP